MKKTPLHWITCIAGLIAALTASLAGAETLRLGATSTARDSGLLKFLLPQFTQDTGIKVLPIIGGSGQTLRNAERGEVSILLVHSPAAEREFMLEGLGYSRTPVMHNYFILVGPTSDPAAIRPLKTAQAALANIDRQGAKFISRDDNSGTHKIEMALWDSLQLTPNKTTYLRAGAGMGRTLQMADQLQAYTLVDRGTWIKFQKRVQLVPLLTDSESLRNPYSVILVKPEDPLAPSFKNAQRLQHWLTGAPGQRAIAKFRVDGEIAFWPQKLIDSDDTAKTAATDDSTL